MAHTRRFLWLVIPAIWLAVPAPARAVAPEIHDDGKFFSPEAVKKANEQIREIARASEKDLLIETFAGVPADRVDKVKEMSSDEKAKFFKEWATERAHQAVVNGVYILICKEPTRLEIVVTAKAHAQFDDKAYQKLRTQLLEDFRAKHYDEGLASAVKTVQSTLAAKPK